MLTIAIIFTLLVALWGHAQASAAPRDLDRDRNRPSGDGHDSTPARPSPTIASSGH